jgi:hypothetical protein
MLALAAGAFALFYVLFVPKPPPESDGPGLPLSTESRPAGYLAAARWLAEQRIPTVSLRRRYDRLQASLRKPTGNLLIVSMPQQVPARPLETAALESWVERGNTLLILAAIHDSPTWIINGDTQVTERIQQLTGLLIKYSTSRKLDLRSMVADRLDIHPRGAHALLAGVQHVTAVSPLPLRHARLLGHGDTLPLELAVRGDSGDPTLWLMRRGAGQIILSSTATLFSNAAVPLSDNARLLANIVAWGCEPGGAVVFDDAHQGATDYYDGKAFFADSRLHRTLGWIVLLWLVFVLGSLPLRAAKRSWQPLDETAYVEASARYFAAVVPPAEAAQRLIERFLRGPQANSHPGNQTDLWQRIDSDPRIADGQRRTLHRLYEQACSGGRVSLAELQNLLAQLRRKLE